MTGRTGTRAVGGSPSSSPLHAPAAITTWRARQDSPAWSATPVTRVPALSSSTRATGGCSRSSHPGRLTRPAQRHEHQPWIDRVILRRFQRQAHGRRERGLALAGLARPETRRAQAERIAPRDLALQLARLVLVAGEHERAGPQQAHLIAARLLQLGREPRPHLRRAQPQLEQRPRRRRRTRPRPPARASRRPRTRCPARPRRARAPSRTDPSRVRARRRSGRSMPPPTIATSTSESMGLDMG